MYCSIFQLLSWTVLNIQVTQIESNRVHHERVFFLENIFGAVEKLCKMCSNFCSVRVLKDTETALPASGWLVKHQRRSSAQSRRYCICFLELQKQSASVSADYLKIPVYRDTKG